MLASAMVQKIKDYGFDGISDADLLIYVNDAYHEFCGLEPWPFLEKTATLTVSGAGKVTSPTDVRSVQSIVDTTNGTTLTPERRDSLVSRFSQTLTTTGPASYYYWVGDELYLYPIPGGGTYTMDYLRDEPDLLTSEAPIFKAKYHLILVYGGAERAAIETDDIEMAEFFESKVARRVAKAREDFWRKNYDEPDTIQDVTWTDYVDWDSY